MHVVGGRVHVGARLLALCRVVVNPAVAESAVERRDVVGAQRRHGGLHFRLCLLDRVVQRDVGDERRIQIVVVQLIDAENARAQLEIAMERWQVLVHAVDERRVDGRSGYSGRRATPQASSRSAGPSRRNIADWTFALIVEPSERRNDPRPSKNASITFCRSARFALARAAEYVETSRRACLPSESVTVGHGDICVQQDVGGVAAACGHRHGARHQRFFATR